MVNEKKEEKPTQVEPKAEEKSPKDKKDKNEKKEEEEDLVIK